MPVHKPKAPPPKRAPLPVVNREPVSYQHHRECWKDCTRCHLHETRNRVVLARGVLPCDILFVGEAPGKSEDVLRGGIPGIGRPFVGPAGQLLDDIIAESIGKAKGREWYDYGPMHPASRYRYALTNLVACIPVDPETGSKDGQPKPVSIKACAPRLVELFRLAKPRLVVAVGGLSSTWLDRNRQANVWKAAKWSPTKFPPMVDILHPAYILRKSLSQKRLLTDQCVADITEAVEDYLEG